MTKSHKILNVSKNATNKEIKKAFRKQVKKSHPDHGGNKKEIQKLIEAKNELLAQNKQKQINKNKSLRRKIIDYLSNI